MKEIVEKALNQYNLNLPFVLYSKPNSDLVSGMFQDNDFLFEVNDFSEKGFVFASFDGSQTYIIPENESIVLNVKVSKKEIRINEIDIELQNSVVKNDFEKIVRKAILSIENNEFKKVVVSRKETIDHVNFDLMTVFEKMIYYYPATFVYCFYHPKIGLWLGATPEQLIKVEDHLFHTMALAGTQKDKGLDEVVWQDKEKQEQQFVTDYIVSELSKVSNSIQVSAPQSIKAGSIWHIKTAISGMLHSIEGLKDVVHLLHPTPAVCGLPKNESKQFIVINEKYDRDFYTGYLGELNRISSNSGETTDLYVNLRCMQIETILDSKNTKAYLYMGCGITKDSIPEKEWEESVNKSMTMKRCLDF
jgi:isochorismate synthase